MGVCWFVLDELELSVVAAVARVQTDGARLGGEGEFDERVASGFLASCNAHATTLRWRGIWCVRVLVCLNCCRLKLSSCAIVPPGMLPTKEVLPSWTNMLVRVCANRCPFLLSPTLLSPSRSLYLPASPSLSLSLSLSLSVSIGLCLCLCLCLRRTCVFLYVCLPAVINDSPSDTRNSRRGRARCAQ